jgi:hypothetical protein
MRNVHILFLLYLLFFRITDSKYQNDYIGNQQNVFKTIF